MLEQQPIAPGAPPPPSPLPADDEVERRALSQVLALLSRAQARQRRIRTLSAALFAFGGLAVVLPACFALAAGGSALARPLALVAFSSAAAAIVWFGLWKARAEVGSLESTARLVGPRLPSPTLRRGLLSAYELGRELELKGGADFSPALARAHIAQVAQSARTADLAQALPDRSVRRAARAFLFGALLFLFAVALLRDTMSRGARALAFGSEGPAAKASSSPEPITGEIELTFVYPAYTRLPSRVVPNTNGEISAPRGTQVKLKTRSDREVAQAFVVLKDSALPLEVQQGRDLSGTLLVSDSGSYRFRFLDKRGRKLAEGPPIPIAVEADQAPKASILEPAGDTEVDPRARVTLRFEAEDDYGLSEVALLYKLPGASKPERVVLQRQAEPPRRASGDYSWDLTAPGLMPGDTIDYYVEAVDNDEVSGKKTGVSKTQHLKLFSESEHHRKIVQEISRAWEKLVMLLGDRLEAPETRAETRTEEKILAQADTDVRALELARELLQLSRALQKEKSPEPLWQALAHASAGLTQAASSTSDARSALAVRLRRGIGLDAEPMGRLVRALEAEIAEEEKDVLYLEALVDQQRIADLLALAKELAARRRDLADVLEKYRNAPDAATKEQLSRELARLKERMDDLMARMAELSRQVSDEHFNHEALQEMAKSESMMSTFDKIQDLLHQDKVEEAMKELEKLGQAIDKMDSDLQRSAHAPKSEQYEQLHHQLNDFARDLDRLESSQKDLLEQTQKVRDNYKDALKQRLAQKGNGFVQRLREKAAEARQKLDAVTDANNFYQSDELKRAKSEVEDLDKALAVQDFDQAAQSAAKALDHARELSDEMERQAVDSRRYPAPWQKQAAEAQANARNAQGAIPPIQEISQSLESLFPPPGAAMSEGDRQSMRGQAQRQGALQEQAKGLRQRMGELNKQAPIFPSEAQEMMEQSGERMGRAQGQMQARNPTGASAEERAALDQIEQLKRGLAQRKGGGAGGEGEGVPNPWMIPGQSLPQPGEQEGEDGPSSQEKVEIPGADKYEVPPEYRKDILDAMKQSAPEKYKEQVKRYYEEIVK